MFLFYVLFLVIVLNDIVIWWGLVGEYCISRACVAVNAINDYRDLVLGDLSGKKKVILENGRVCLMEDTQGRVSKCIKRMNVFFFNCISSSNSRNPHIISKILDFEFY